MSKKYIVYVILALLAIPTCAPAQSELFGEKINGDFVAKVQPDLVKQALDPATTPYDFMLACKRLGVYGDKTAAAAVAKSLADPKRSHSARMALQAMPFAEALVELRNAVKTVDDPILKAGVINSLGMREDEEAIALLVPYLSSREASLVEAAAFALARIGSPKYRDAMTGLLGNAEFAKAKKYADLNLMYGEFLRVKKHGDDAQKVFAAIIANAPRDYHKEAACFQTLLLNDAASQKLAATWLAGDDTVAFRAALRATRFVKDDAMTVALLQAYAKADTARKAMLLPALGDQCNPKGQSVLLNALGSEDETLKEAAVIALRSYADRGSFKGLVAAALAGDAKMRHDSVAVIEMLDDSVTGDILAMLKQDEARQAFGAELVGARKIGDGLADVFALAKSGPASVRPAAIRAVGELAQTEQFNWLVDQVVAKDDADTTDAAKSGLKAACGVVPDKASAAKKIVQAAEQVKGRKETRLYLFQQLAVLGGSEARSAVAKAAMSSDREQQDLATNVLGGWMDPDVAPILLALANTQGYPYANRAIRGYLRLARQFAMPNWMRAAMVRDAMASPAFSAREKEIADTIVKQYKLDLSVAETADQKLIRNIELVEAIYGAPGDNAKRKDVTAKLRDKIVASDSAKIELGAYNVYFDGDPAPGVPKKLFVTIRYRDSNALKTFEVNEGAVITLPKK